MMTGLPAPAGRMLEAARHGCRAVTEVLTGVRALPGTRPDTEQAMAAANFLGYAMFTVQIANGLHPRSAADFVPGEDRGAELARQFINAGTVEVCCDYCGYLMADSLAQAAASQMRAIHGDQAAGQWEALCYALTGPPF